MSKLQNLQSAINSSSGKAPAAPAVPATTATRSPGRADQANISAWLPKEFKRSIRLVQARKPDNSTLQDLMAEAFNDLFSKYDVPTVHYE